MDPRQFGRSRKSSITTSSENRDVHRKSSLPTEDIDIISKLLQRYSYSKYFEFESNYVTFSLKVDPELRDYLLNDDSIIGCIRSFHADLSAAETFLRNTVLDVADQPRFEQAMKNLYTALDHAYLYHLLVFHGYKDVQAFESVYLPFSLILKCDLRGIFEIESPRFSASIDAFRTQLNKAAQFLESVLTESSDKGSTQAAIRRLNLTLEQTSESKIRRMGRNST